MRHGAIFLLPLLTAATSTSSDNTLTLVTLDEAPVIALADSVSDCFDCVLGIWDDVGMTRNSGVMEAGVAKDIYLGIRFGQGYNDLTGIEFSIAGMRFEEDGIILLEYEGVTPISDVSWYLPQAPADTSSTSTGQGGMLILWNPPLIGDQALVRLRILSSTPPTDHVLQVKRMYPTSNPVQWQTPVLVQNRNPVFPIVRISGDCYVLNWSGDPNVGCDVITSVNESTWSGVKQLFR